MNEKYDSVLLSILQHEGEIVNFLDVILGFLYRKTDFYKIMLNKTDKMGFPPGVAQKILMTEFGKFEFLAKEHDLTHREEQIQQSKSNKLLKVEETIASIGKQFTKSDSMLKVKKHDANKQKVQNSTSHKHSEEAGASASGGKAVGASVPSVILNKCEPSDEDMAPLLEDISKPNTLIKDDSQNISETVVQSDDQIASASNPGENVTKDDDENPELTRQQKIFQDNPESYNGAMRDNYSWSQHITEVDAYIKIPPYIKKGKEVKVVIDKHHLKVSYQSKEGEMITVVDDDLVWDVAKEESIWSLVPEHHVHVNMEKKEERWWESLFVDEPKISVRKIDASRPITDLDDEAQAKIEEMMYNEHRKRLGLPQSHEEKMYETMKKAWDAEGSPFKGQPFDPTAFTVNPSGIVTVNNQKS